MDQTGGSTSPLYRAAVELAASQMNAALDRSGSRVKFEVIFGDSKSNPAFAQSEALRLINQEQVKALVTDSSGVTVAVNRLNYDPATPAKQKVPITCFQCSSSFINDANVVESDPLTQAAERDIDNWLFRVFYVAKYEAAVLVQIALSKTDSGKGNGDGNFKIGILADAGHRALATGIAAALPSFYQQPSSTEIIYMSALDKLGADWAKVIDTANETTGKTDGVPDVVIVAMLPEAASEAIKAYRQGGHAVPILSNNSFRRNYILKQVGAAANGLEGSSVTLADKSGSGEAFVRAFRAATGQSPEMTSSGAYDATATLMLAALVAAGDAKRSSDVAPSGHSGGPHEDQQQERTDGPPDASRISARRLVDRTRASRSTMKARMIRTTGTRPATCFHRWCIGRWRTSSSWNMSSTAAVRSSRSVRPNSRPCRRIECGRRQSF